MREPVGGGPAPALRPGEVGVAFGVHQRAAPQLVAPEHLDRRTMELIEEQTERARAGKPSRIFAKLNALVDYRVIEALYRASQAGVPTVA